MNGEGARMTFSEDRLRQLLAEFKLDLLEEFAKKASQDAVDLLGHRVMQLELWQASMIATEGTREKLSAKSFALWTLLVMLFAGLVSGIATLVWLAVG